MLDAWSQINTSGSKNLLIGAYYRPPSDKRTSLQQLELSLSRINASNTNVIIGGDLNLGHIDWSIPQVIPGKPETELNIKLLDIIDENNLHQIVNVPTRKERILDLILVTNPSNINKVNTLPPLAVLGLVTMMFTQKQTYGCLKYVNNPEKSLSMTKQTGITSSLI